MNSLTFVPQLRRTGFAPSGLIYRPSGALSSAQIAEFQGTLAWLGHLPRVQSSVTGRLPVAPASAIRSFQDSYNRDPVVIARGFSPRPPIRVDGDWGPTTQAALQNFVPAARAAGFGMGLGIAAPATMDPTVLPTDGYGGRQVGPSVVIPAGPLGPVAPMGTVIPQPNVGKVVADAFAGIGKPPVLGSPSANSPQTAIRPSTPSQVSPLAPLAPPVASATPWGPILAIGGGVVVLGGALYVRSRRKKGK